MKSSRLNDRSVALRCQRVSEWSLYGCVLLSPWLFGCVGATGEFFLTMAISIALFAYTVGCFVEGLPRWTGRRASVVILLGLLGISAVAWIHQITFGSDVVGVLAPGVKKWASWAGETEPGSWLDRWSSGERLALHAVGSYQAAVRLLLLAGVFVVVQNFRSPRACLYRLSVIGAMTGTGLALFGLAQHFGSHDGLVYWTYDIEGGLGFGPFINRNHYPFFLNLCFGLTVGLLIERLSVMGRHWYRLLLTDPTVGWLLVAISFMLASLIACGSRGGVLSLVLAMSSVLLLRLRASNAGRGAMMMGLVAVPATLILVWVGFDFQESRLQMLKEADRYASDGRWKLWAAALKSVPDFPWFGSGGETYRYWDDIYQSGDPAWNNWKLQSLRADNEFLDVLCEYGVFGLASLIALVGGTVWTCFAKCRRSGLAAGAAIGLLAIVGHSIADFGLRIPATGVLATLILALLSSVHTSSRVASAGRSRSGNDVASAKFGRWGASAVVGATVAFVAFVAIRARSDSFYANRHRDQAYVALALERNENAYQEIKQAVLANPMDIQMRSESVRVVEYLMAIESNESLENRERRRTSIVQDSLAMLHLCPLAWQPYAWLAKYGQEAEIGFTSDQTFDSDDWKTRYLLRARDLHPSEPELAYITGNRLHSEKGLAAALPHWRDSLAVSTHRMDEIFSKVEGNLTSSELEQSLLPRDPVVIFEAARRQRAPEKKEVLYAAALELLEFPERSSRQLTFGERESWRAKVLAAQGKLEKALRALERALNEFPENIEMRLRRVHLLMELGELDRATSEVRVLLTLAPDHSQVKRLQGDLAERKARELE